MPARYADVGDPGEPGPAVTLDVDGELFEVRTDGRGGTHYTWLTGPNQGYGFGSGPIRAYGSGERPARDQTAEEHRAGIRAFLAGINPETGYLD